MSETVILFLMGLYAFVLCGCLYILIRNNWVCRRRLELVGYHFSSAVDWRRHGFDETYGSYDQWLYRRPFTWNAARLAGLPEWPA